MGDTAALRILFRMSAITWLCVFHVPCWAADKIVMRFVQNPRTSEHVVRLGDLVEVLDGKSPATQRLLELPLGPAPRENELQTWHTEMVLQHLELRGQHPSSIRWSGVTQTQLRRVAQPDGVDTANIQPAFVQQRTIELAENLVAQAIGEYLMLRTGERVDWRIRPQVPARLADVVRVRRNILGIGGGAEPWLGDQKFVLQIKDRDQIQSVPIQASVELPPMVIVAKRPLRREEIITAEMLDLAPMPNGVAEEEDKYFAVAEQLIGKQVKRSVSTGLPISSDYVGAPLVIARNEMVEVESVSGQVVVRTMGRSLGSGAVGDLIDIETISDRRRMLATIVGPLKVRVAAMAARGGVER